MTIVYIILHALGVVPTAAFINNFFKGEATILGFSSKQLISWGCAAVIGFVAANFHWGVIGDGAWYVVAAKSIIAGLVANGIYKVEFVGKLLEVLHLKQS